MDKPSVHPSVMNGQKLNWNHTKLQRFKKDYDAATKSDKDTFTFEDQEFYVPYAAYLIEYLEGILGK